MPHSPIEIWAWLPRLNANRDYFDGWFNASLEASESGGDGVFATDRSQDRASRSAARAT